MDCQLLLNLLKSLANGYGYSWTAKGKEEKLVLFTYVSPYELLYVLVVSNIPYADVRVEVYLSQGQYYQLRYCWWWDMHSKGVSDLFGIAVTCTVCSWLVIQSGTLGDPTWYNGWSKVVIRYNLAWQWQQWCLPFRCFESKSFALMMPLNSNTF